MNVLIPIETTARELLYKTCIGMEMARRGLPVFLGTKAMIGTLARSERGYVYFDKGFHAGISEPLYAIIHARDGRIVNLDEEGAVDFADGTALRHRYAPALFAASSCVFFWGAAQHEDARPRIAAGCRAVVTGHPRFQLLGPAFRGLYAAEADSIRRRYGSFVLVNTNMGFGNNLRGDAFVRGHYRERFPFIDRLIAFDRAKLDRLVTFVRRLTERSPRPVVLRPHPEEDADTYRRHFAGLDRVHVCFEGSVVPWLLASDAMVHPDCTTAIEAVMLDRPAISLLPDNPDHALVTPLPCAVSYRAASEGDAVDLVSAGAPDWPLPPGAAAVLQRHFHTGEDSTALIVGEVMALAGGAASSPGLSLASRAAVWRRRLRARLTPPSADRLIANKLRGFTLAEVQRVRGHVVGVKPELEAVRIRGVADGLYAVLPPDMASGGAR